MEGILIFEFYSCVFTQPESKQAKQSAKQNADRIKVGLPILDSFSDVTGKWLDSIANQNSEGTLFKKRSRLTTWIFPVIGDKPINAIKSAEVLAALKPLIEAGKLDTAHRLRAEINAIFAYAIVHNLADYDPAQPVAKQIPAQKVSNYWPQASCAIVT